MKYTIINIRSRELSKTQKEDKAVMFKGYYMNIIFGYKTFGEAYGKNIKVREVKHLWI